MKISIGMHHDSSGNSCPKEGYIMSPSRGTNGETLWSSCSANVATSMSWAKCLEDVPSPPPKSMDHSKYEDQPGEAWGAKKQCEILLRDKDAELYNPDKLQVNFFFYFLILSFSISLYIYGIL